MKISYLFNTVVTIVATVLIGGCGGNSSDSDKNHYQNQNSHENSQEKEFKLSNYQISKNISRELKNSIAYMGNEERLAYDVYQNLYKYHKNSLNLEIRQLYNISTKSETKHIKTVHDIVERYNLQGSTNVDMEKVQEYNLSKNNMVSGIYDIAIIQELYDNLYSLGIQDEVSALKVGCMVEVTDINDLDNYIKEAEKSQATDIIEAFKFLRDGSYNHYWAFDKGLKNHQVKNGCYFEDDILLTNKNGIYPKNEHSSDYNEEK